MSKIYMTREDWKVADIGNQLAQLIGDSPENPLTDIAILLGDLLKYVRHTEDCKAHIGEEHACVCGLRRKVFPDGWLVDCPNCSGHGCDYCDFEGHKHKTIA